MKMAKVEERWLSSFAYRARPDLVFLKIAFYELYSLQQLPHLLDLIGRWTVSYRRLEAFHR